MAPVAVSWIHGRLGPLSEEASFSGNNEPNIDFYFMNPAPLASCNGSCALLHRFLYQRPDYTVVVHPKRSRENVGEEKEKSQFSQPH